MQPVLKIHNPKTNNLIEETFQGNTVTQSIKDEKKAKWLFGKTVNFILQNLKSKHLVCLNFWEP